MGERSWKPALAGQRAPAGGRPHPDVAAVRSAVRGSLAALADAGRRPLVLVACSGGPDSLALAAATAFVAPRLGLAAGAVTIDHGLQAGSAGQAERAGEALRRLGLDPVVLRRVDVAARGQPGGERGPEAAARDARYAALESVAAGHGAVAVLLGHTLDDQAETVLLGLARGSGARSLAGMAPASGRYLRPLLGLRREQTRAACAALGLEPWDDPQNADQAFARTRVRTRLLPLMEELLGPGIAAALARTADQLRADAAVLDDLAAAAAGELMRDWAAGQPGGATLDAGALACLPAALRARVLRRAAIAAGSPAGALGLVHVAGMDALVTDWHGQRGTDLPGGIRCSRRYGRLHFTART